MSSTPYKQSVTAYLILIGPTHELVGFNLKLLDIIDGSGDELSMLAYTLSRRLALSIISIASELSKKFNKDVTGACDDLLSGLSLIDESVELDRAIANVMVLRAVNKTLQSINRIAGTKFPDIGKIYEQN